MADSLLPPTGGAEKPKEMEVKAGKKPMTLKRLILLAIIGICMLLSAACIYYGAYMYMDNNRKAVTLDGIDAIEAGKYARAGLLLTQAADAGDKLATEFVAWFECRRGNYEKAFHYANVAVHKNLPRSNMILGLLSLQGLGIDPGADTAYELFVKAVNNPGVVLEGRREGLADIIDLSLRYAKKRADYVNLAIKGAGIQGKGSLLAMGDILFLGDGLDRNPVKSIEYWQKAAKQGVPEAKTRLASVFFHGYGTPRNPKMAVDYYQEAIKAEEPVAMYDFALIALRKDSSALSVAKQLLEESAKRGFGPAMTALGVLNIGGGSRTEAYKMFEQAYEAHEVSGSVFYALMSFNGDSCKKDEGKGLSILVSEKEQGSQIAKDLIRALSKGFDGREIFNELGIIARKIIYGELSFYQGAPEGQSYLTDSYGSTKYYTKNAGKDEELVAALGRRNYPEQNSEDSITVGGQTIEMPSLGNLILYSNPTTGAKPFIALVEPPKAPPPPIPPSYRQEPETKLPEGF